MTEPDRKFEEEFRRALCAASDLVVPAGDGLNKIRERTARQSPVLGWLLAYVVHLPRQLARAGRVAASEAAATAHGYSSLGLVLASARRWPGQTRQLLRTPGVWLRPALASATALILVIAVTLSIPRLRQQVTAQLDSAFGSSSGSGSSGGPNGVGVGGAQSSSATQMGSATPTYMAGKPWLATMPPGSAQCRDQASSGTRTIHHVSGTGTTPPSSQPKSGPMETAGAGTNAGAKSAGLARLNEVGPEPVSATCPSSSAPANRSTSQAATPPATTPVTTPAVAASTSPVTSPTTTPVTSPTTTPVTTPTTTPVTTPTVTTSPTDTSTSSSDSTASTGGTGDTGAGTGTTGG